MILAKPQRFGSWLLSKSCAEGKGGAAQPGLLCKAAWTGLLPPTFLPAQPPDALCCWFVVISLVGSRKKLHIGLVKQWLSEQSCCVTTAFWGETGSQCQDQITSGWCFKVGGHSLKHEGPHMQKQIRRFRVPCVPGKAVQHYSYLPGYYWQTVASRARIWRSEES